MGLIALGAVLYIAWQAPEASEAQEPVQANVEERQVAAQTEVEEPVIDPEGAVEEPLGIEAKDGASITSEPDPVETDLSEAEPKESELPENPLEIVMPEEIEEEKTIEPQTISEMGAEAEDIVEISAESVDQIEDSLSVGDYAKGLSLLAQLPAETVDRFVELRKDGFTKEEQAEVKMILLASFEGEDLNWIVETYQKLQP